jgi:hypothetical protein
VLFGFQAKGEPVKAELQYFRKAPNMLHAVASKTKIEILGAARRPREAQFHRDSAFQVVDIDDTFLERRTPERRKVRETRPNGEAFPDRDPAREPHAQEFSPTALPASES